MIRFAFALGLLMPLIIFVGILILITFSLATHDTLKTSNGLYGALVTDFRNLTGGSNDLKEGIAKIGAVLTTILGLFFLQKEGDTAGIASFLKGLPFDKMKLKLLDSEPGYREEFKRDFNLIMEASKKKLIIFIDDLDRVEGPRALDLFEAMNFVVDTASRPKNYNDSNSNVIFILGMDVERVTANIGTRLIEINNSNEDEDKMDLGLAYMEKLVQLFISVPGIESSTTTSDLMTPSAKRNT